MSLVAIRRSWSPGSRVGRFPRYGDDIKVCVRSEASARRRRVRVAALLARPAQGQVLANSIRHMQAGDERPAARSRSAHEAMSVGQMVRENRPHRLVRDLSKVLVATLASAAFFIVNSDA